MKTLSELNIEIGKHRRVMERSQETGPIPKKEVQRMAFFQNCKLYLETDPDEIFLGCEQLRLRKRLKELNDNYNSDFSMLKNSKHREEYNKFNGVKTMQEQLELLNYLMIL